MATCYRHPDRETGVSCSNCGNPICPDCMTATPVGMRCPDCAGQKQRVATMRTMYVQPTATYILIAINVLIFLGAGGFNRAISSPVEQDFLLAGVLVADGDYWRLITSGFLHSGPFHIMFNMYALYWLGTMLEPVLGHVRFVALYVASLLAGSFGVLLLTAPDRWTVGASGAVFGLMAAAFVLQRERGIDPMQSGLGVVIALNLGITFLIPGISIGGHLGGLVGGAIAAFAMERMPTRSVGAGVAACAAVAVISAVGAIAVA